MRNLVIFNDGKLDFESRYFPDLCNLESSFNTFNDAVTCVMSNPAKDAFEVQQMTKDGGIEVLCFFESPCPGSLLLSFHQFDDSGSLIFVFNNGDVIAAHLDSEATEGFVFEIVGLMDVELSAAQWSPDEEILVLVTCSLKLILLSRSFEPILETQLNAHDIKDTSKSNVSVGWGKEETQFRGRGFKALERERDALKHAGLDLENLQPLHDPTVKLEERGHLSARDDNSVHISWRDDCEVFAVSLRLDYLPDCSKGRRVIRVFSRDGKLEAVSEAVDGLNTCLSWRLQGSLLATTRDVAHDDGKVITEVLFFERNGLRHGEFATEQPGVLDLSWSSNGEILALLFDDKVQFWTSKNYHWYLKQEISTGLDRCVMSVKFHPEKPMTAMLTSKSDGLNVISFGSITSDGPSVRGYDRGLVSVIDGCRVLLTPLALANIPPPLSMLEVVHPEPVKAVAVSICHTRLVALTSTSNFYLTENLQLKRGSSIKTEKFQIKEFNESSCLRPKQICILKLTYLVVLSDGPSTSFVHVFNLANQKLHFHGDLEARAVLLKALADSNRAIIQLYDGTILDFDEDQGLKNASKFPQMCTQVEAVLKGDDLGTHPKLVVAGLTDSGKLFCGDRYLANNITSIKMSDQFLCITTAQSRLCFIHLGNLDSADMSYIAQGEEQDERSRQIERGSVLITTAPSKYSVVLQAPRGNLETIYPRIMVLTAVRKFIQESRYLEAFLACRSHRIDLDILHDYDPQSFEQNISSFINQVKKTEHLDLLISCLHEYDVTKEKYLETAQDNHVSTRSHGQADLSGRENKVNRVCGIFLKELSDNKYPAEYLQVQLTAYACQKPPDSEGALKLISKQSNTEVVDRAITHLCCLQDASVLYNKALCLYDVKLALNFAQRSQLDPKEYLPFLQTLHGESQGRRGFLIDDHLKRFESALSWLFELGEDRNEEFDAYVVSHNLYTKALALYRHDNKRFRRILILYASFLSETSEFLEAARIFEFLDEFQLALENYLLAKSWKEALTIGRNIKSDDDFRSIAKSLAILLEDDRRYSDAATIESTYLQNNIKAVELFCKAFDFDSALLIAATTSSKDTQEVFDSEIRESFGIMSELLADCNGQLISQLNRLREIRRKKEIDPVMFYGTSSQDLDTPDDVSIAASDTSTTPSFFTRYTGKSNETAKTGASRKTLKNKKREERKRAKGRKGTVYEEEYLISSVGRLIERLNSSLRDGENLVFALVRRHMWEEAYQIKSLWKKITSFLDIHVVEIYTIAERDRQRVDDNGQTYLAPEIPLPKIFYFPDIKALAY